MLAIQYTHYKEAIEQSLMPEEVEALAAHLQPLVENGQGMRRSALAYL